MSRAASKQRPLEVKLSSRYWTITIVLSLLTCGLGYLLMWFNSREWPQIIDDEGVTGRDGTRHLWNDATGIAGTFSSETGRREPGSFTIVAFPAGRVTFPLKNLDPADEIDARTSSIFESIWQKCLRQGATGQAS